MSNLWGIWNLILSDNQLTGSIPANLGRQLEILDLSNNALTGEIPADFDGLGYWLDLYLQNNRLSGVIGSSLGDYLGSLDPFDISGNFFSCPYPESLRSRFYNVDEVCSSINGKIRFENGQVADANQLNANFDLVVAELERLKARLSRLEPQPPVLDPDQDGRPNDVELDAAQLLRLYSQISQYFASRDVTNPQWGRLG